MTRTLPVQTLFPSSNNLDLIHRNLSEEGNQTVGNNNYRHQNSSFIDSPGDYNYRGQQPTLDRSNSNQSNQSFSNYPNTSSHPQYYPDSFVGDTGMMRDMNKHNVIPPNSRQNIGMVDRNNRNNSGASGNSTSSRPGSSSTTNNPGNVNDYNRSPATGHASSPEQQKDIEFGKLFSWGSHLPRFVAKHQPHQNQHNHEPGFRLNNNNGYRSSSYPRNNHPSQTPHFQRSNSSGQNNGSCHNSPPYSKNMKRPSNGPGLMLPPEQHNPHNQYSRNPYSDQQQQHPHLPQTQNSGNMTQSQNPSRDIPGGFLSTIQSPASEQFNRNQHDTCSVISRNETLSVGSGRIPENLGPPIPYDPSMQPHNTHISQTQPPSRYRQTSMNSNFSHPDVCSPRSVDINIGLSSNNPGSGMVGNTGNNNPTGNVSSAKMPKLSKNETSYTCSDTGNHSMSHFSSTGNREPYQPSPSSKSNFHHSSPHSRNSQNTYTQLQPYQQNNSSSSPNYQNNNGNQGFMNDSPPNHNYNSFPNKSNSYNSEQNNSKYKNNSPENFHTQNNTSSSPYSQNHQSFNNNTNSIMMRSPTIKQEVSRNMNDKELHPSSSTLHSSLPIGAKSTQSFFEMFKDQFTVSNPDSRKATLSMAKSYMDAASRRNDQKHAFDRLEQVLSEICSNRPSIFGSFGSQQDRPLGGGKLSKSALLINASQEIAAINEARRSRHSEIIDMKAKIKKMKEEIAEIQCQLPSSSGNAKNVGLKLEVESSISNQTNIEVFHNSNLDKTRHSIINSFAGQVHNNWRYYYFSKLVMKPLLAPYSDLQNRSQIQLI